jgi:predicted nucleic acid-binding protein
MSISAVTQDALRAALAVSGLGVAVRLRMRGHELHRPAHLDAEVLSALGRLHRAGHLAAEDSAAADHELERAPIVRHHLAGLLHGAWKARDRVRTVDALYLELSAKLNAPLLTADARLAEASETTELVALS